MDCDTGGGFGGNHTCNLQESQVFTFWSKTTVVKFLFLLHYVELWNQPSHCFFGTRSLSDCRKTNLWRSGNTLCG